MAARFKPLGPIAPRFIYEGPVRNRIERIRLGQPSRKGA